MTHHINFNVNVKHSLPLFPLQENHLPKFSPSLFLWQFILLFYICLFHLCMDIDVCQEQKCFSNTVDPTLKRVVSFLAWILGTKFCFPSRIVGLLISKPSLQFRWRHLHSTTTVLTTFIISSLLLMISQRYLQICIPGESLQCSL